MLASVKPWSGVAEFFPWESVWAVPSGMQEARSLHKRNRRAETTSCFCSRPGVAAAACCLYHASVVRVLASGAPWHQGQRSFPSRAWRTTASRIHVFSCNSMTECGVQRCTMLHQAVCETGSETGVRNRVRNRGPKQGSKQGVLEGDPVKNLKKSPSHILGNCSLFLCFFP